MKKHIIILALISTFSWLISSCDESYDLDNLDPSITVGGDSLHIPLGSTDSIFFRDAIDSLDLDFLIENEDGSFAITQEDIIDLSENFPSLGNIGAAAQNISDEFFFELPKIGEDLTLDGTVYQITQGTGLDPINVDDLDINIFEFDRVVQLSSQPSPSPSTRLTPPLRLEVQTELEQTLTLPIYQLPSEIKSVDKVYMVENGISTFKLTKEMMEGVNFDFEYIKFIFPEEIKVKEANQDNAIILRNASLSGAGIELDYEVQSIDLSKVSQTSGELSTEFILKIEFHAIVEADQNAQQVPDITEWTLRVQSNSNVMVSNADITVNQFLTDVPEGAEHEIEILLDGEIADLGTIEIVPEGTPIIKVEIPNELLGIEINPSTSKGIIVKVPEFLILKTSPNYEYDKENNTVTLKGETGLTVDLLVERLIITPQVRPEDNNSYSVKGVITVEGELEVMGGETNTGDIIDLPNKEVTIVITVPTIRAASVSISEYSYDYSTTFPISFTVDEGVEMIKSIQTVYLNNAQIDLSLSLEEPIIDLGVNPVSLEATITFPDIFVFDDARIQNGIMKIKQEDLLGAKTLNILDLNVVALNLDIENMGQPINIEEEVVLDMHLYVLKPSINPNLAQNIEFRSNIDIPALSFSRFVGIIDYSIDPMEEIVPFSVELPENINTENLTLDVDNPILKLEIESNVGIPISAKFSIVAYKDGEVVPGSEVSNVILSLPAADPNEDVTITKFALGNNTSLPGYTNIQADLAALITKLPDELRIYFDANTNVEAIHDVRLDKDFKVKLSYQLEAPLKFGGEFNLSLESEINDIPKEITQTLNSGSAITLNGEAKSNLPLSLLLNIVFLDLNGNPMDIQVPQAIIDACNPDGSVATSEFSLKLTLAENQIIEPIMTMLLLLDIQGNADLTQISITKDSFVQLYLSALIEGGIELEI